MDDIEKLKNMIDESDKLVFFGGAGVSTASGIPDFRSSHGLYSMVPEEIVSHHFFMEHPKEFFEFYFDKMVYKNAKPNNCHKYLAELEKHKNVTIVTQNIDGLHQKAGSKNVIELHGTTLSNHCIKCGKYYSLDEIDTNKVPRCACGGIIKPDVVLYEEMLDENKIEKAIDAIEKADTLIICGTSLVVYPAASFINYFRGKNLIVINMSEVSADKRANLVIHDDIDKVFKKLSSIK